MSRLLLYSSPTAHSPLLVPPSDSPDPDKPPDVGPLPRTLPPLLPLTHTQARHAHTRQTRRPALKRKEKNGKEETSGGDSPPMQHPREGLPSPKLCLSITPKPAAARVC